MKKTSPVVIFLFPGTLTHTSSVVDPQLSRTEAQWRNTGKQRAGDEVKFGNVSKLSNKTFHNE